MKPKKHRLILKHETVRHLNLDEMSKVGGAALVGGSKSCWPPDYGVGSACCYFTNNCGGSRTCPVLE